MANAQMIFYPILGLVLASIGSAAAQAGGLATSVLINLSIITASARPPLHRITYLNQGTHARRVLPSLRKGLYRAAQPGFLLGPPYPTPIAYNGQTIASIISMDLAHPLSTTGRAPTTLGISRR